MKKLLSLALVAMMATASVNAAMPQHDKCTKECCKKCDDKCKEACKAQKCTKEESAKKCEKTACGKEKAS